MAIVTLWTEWTTLQQAFNNGFQQLNNGLVQVGRAKTGTLGGGWGAPIDSRGSFFEFTWETIAGDLVNYRSYTQEIEAGHFLPVSLVSGPPMGSFMMGFAPQIDPSSATLSELLNWITGVYGTMVVTLAGGTLQPSAVQTFIPVGRTKPWIASRMMFISNTVSYGGLIFQLLDFNNEPLKLGLAAGQREFYLPGGTNLIIPQAANAQLLPDIDLAINNGSAIYSIMSNTVTEG